MRLLLVLVFSAAAQASNSLKEKYPGETCYRKCNGTSRICYFQFTLEQYSAMGAACNQCKDAVSFEDCFKTHCVHVDGVERGINTVNRQIPAPLIDVCQNDFVVVDVMNKMAGRSSTIHWHGLHMRETPWMDGVPFVTQCPISFGNTFRYAFYATEPGTQWYHAHTGFQKFDGLYGILLIRRPNDPHQRLYDFDLPQHAVIVSDWMHDLADMFWPGLPSRHPGNNAENVLINGKGRFQSGSVATKTPLAVFKVQKDSRYRFRMVNACNNNCAVRVQVQNHRMQVIASDSYDLVEETFDSFYFNSGERYDFVLHANQTPGNYCVQMKLMGGCATRKLEQYAVLTYADNNDPVSVNEYKELSQLWESCRSSQWDQKRILNDPRTECHGPENDVDNRCIVDMKGIHEFHSAPEKSRILFGEPDVRREIEFGVPTIPSAQFFQEGSYEAFANPRGINVLVRASLDNISHVTPPVSLLTQTDDWDEDLFCDVYKRPKSCAVQEVCLCVHRIKVALGAIVELKLTSPAPSVARGTVVHPFHLHGFPMYVIKSGWLTETREPEVRLDSPFKDTVSLPNGGYVTVRFRADNPGMWFFHCHNGIHLRMGMALVVQVGEKGDFRTAPKNFPKCGNFLPEIEELAPSLK